MRLPEIPYDRYRPPMYLVWLSMAFIIVVGSLILGCTSAERGKMMSYGQDHTIELYSGGQLVRSWTSNGKVLTETNSDGYYFTEKETGAHVRVTGDLVITRK